MSVVFGQGELAKLADGCAEEFKGRVCMYEDGGKLYPGVAKGEAFTYSALAARLSHNKSQ